MILGGEAGSEQAGQLIAVYVFECFCNPNHVQYHHTPSPSTLNPPPPSGL
jgi:hypothetical protein